jgi:tetratricopeptide (TPR) repeat protein
LKILEAAGKYEQADELAPSLHHCQTCGPEDKHVKYPADVDKVISSITEVMNQGQLDRGIERLREGIVELQALADKQAAKLSASDPFRELQLRTSANPTLWAKRTLAQLLRLKSESDSSHDRLIEAAACLRETLAASPNDSDRMHLMLTLLDLATTEPSHYEELERLLSEARQCAATSYTTALMLFRRFGATSESRAAIRTALNVNPYVPLVFAAGFNPMDVSNHFNFGDRAEAEGYCLEASHQWVSTPGWSEFVVEAISRKLPTSVGRALNQMAPAAI